MALQDDALGIDGLVDKYAGQGREMVGILGGEVAAGAPSAAVALDFGMASQVVGQAVGYDRPLLDDVHALWPVLVDLVA